MPYAIDEVLNKPGVHVVQRPTTELGTYVFKVGSLTPNITVRLYPAPHGHGVSWEQSHFIKTPVQGSPYATSRPWGDDAPYALHLAVTSITQYYDQAVREHHTPEDSWLVRNEGFTRPADPATLDAVEALLYVTLRLAADGGDQVKFADVAKDMNADFVGRDDTCPEWTAMEVHDLCGQAKPLIDLARRLVRSR